MNKRRDEDYLDIHLTAEQIAEIECRLSDEGPYASEDEVRIVFERLTKKPRMVPRRKR